MADTKVAAITAAMVKDLRESTGAGMMDCKQALTETGGDMAAAQDWLRKKGLAGAGKRAGREAAQGAVEVVVDGTVAALVELNCETDFVAKGADFRSALESLTSLVAKEGDANVAVLAF